jgi:hypothetical protein
MVVCAYLHSYSGSTKRRTMVQARLGKKQHSLKTNQRKGKYKALSSKSCITKKKKKKEKNVFFLYLGFFSSDISLLYVQHLVMCSSIPPLKTWKGKGVEGEATPS